MPPSPTFRIASYNIRKAIGGDGRRDTSRVQAVICALRANVVILQEGDYRFRGRAPLFGAGELLKTTGLTAVDLNHGGPGLGWHGNVLLIGRDVDLVVVRTLVLPGLEPRGAIVADLRILDAPVRIVAGHLGLLPWDRQRQAETMVGALNRAQGEAAIAIGDFNGWGPRPGSLSAFRREMIEVRCGPSYPARRPLTSLDRLFYRGSLSPIGFSTWRDGPAPRASDHLPIWADFAIT